MMTSDVSAGNHLRRNRQCAQGAARRGGSLRGNDLWARWDCERRTNDEGQRAGGFTALRPIAATAAPLRTSAAVSAGASAAVAAAPEILLLSEEESAPLRRFYLAEMRRFLEDPRRRGQRLGNAEKAKNTFAGLRTLMPAAAHATVDDLEDICDEARQLMRQEQLASLATWMAAAAHTAVVGIDSAGSGARGDGTAVLEVISAMRCRLTIRQLCE